VKVGTEDKRKTWIAVVLFVLAVLAVIYQLWPSSSSTPEPAVRTVTPSGTTGNKGEPVTPVFSKLDPSLRLDLLKNSENVTYQGSGRDIFHAQAEPVEDMGKAPDPRKNAESSTPAVAQKPQIPLKFYGFASSENKKQIFLSQGEDIFVAREGDIVKGRYKVLHVNPNNVEIQDVLGNYSQSIQLTLPNS
jgi:hypothetical protein